MFFKFRKAIFIISVTVFLPSVLYASNEENQIETTNESVFKKSYNVVYQFIDEYDYLLTPLSSAIAGMIRCGMWCAAGGGLAGVADELSVYYGYTDKRYLTWGIFGIATGHVIKPSVVSDIGGIAIGILLPSGVLSSHNELIAPVISAIAGNSIAGTTGMINGGVAGILDEALLRSETTDKHYMTFCTTSMAAVNLLGLNPAVSNFVGAMLGLIAANYEKEITDNLLAPIKTVNSLYTTYTKFIPEEQLNTHIEKHALALVGSQFLTQFLSLKIMGYQQNLVYNFERLDNPNGLAWNNFGKEITNVAIFLFPYAIGQSVSGTVDDYFCKKLHFTLEDQVRSELFGDEAALRLSHDSNNTVLMDNLKSDISTIVNSGSGLITNAVSTSVNGAYGVGIIIVNSPNIFVYSALYNKAQTFIAEYLAEQRRKYDEKIRVLDSKFITSFKHDSENIRTITERDGLQATKEKLQQISFDLRQLEGIQKLWSMANGIWWSISGTIDYIFNYYLVGKEVNQGRIPFDNRNKVQLASWQVSNLLSWSGHQAQELAWIDQSLDRVIILEGKMRVSTNNTDQITRVIREGNQLVLQDVAIGVDNRVLVTVKDLKLEMGRVYAVTGETGCGKTSLLSKIKGIKENGVFGVGAIYYPKINDEAPKIVMISQQDYFPLDSSLYEIIIYPDKILVDPILNAPNRKKVELLLAEIGLYAFGKNLSKAGKKHESNILELDSKKNWYTYLSGGEKKKVAVVSAILKEPDILILDEAFDGLDQMSTIIMQRVLKKYLPNSLILVVDHHALNNNYDFYDKELRFVDRKLFLLDISTKKVTY